MDERIARPEGQSATSGNAVGQMPMSVMESLNRGKDAIGDVAAQTMRAAGTDAPQRSQQSQGYVVEIHDRGEH